MAAHSPYSLLHELIDRVAWRSEREMAAAHASVDEMKALNLFGNIGRMMECQHEDAARVGYHGTGKCPDCGKEGIAV